MTDRPKTTLRDCIYGLAVGDALGVPYEFRPRGTFECTDMIGYGTWAARRHLERRHIYDACHLRLD